VDDLRALGVTGVQALARDRYRADRARAGVADVTTGQPVPHDGYVRIGSNTKTFVAVLVLGLVADGRLGLDDTVERWLPGVVSGNGNDGARVTVRQLLQHTSGLPEYVDTLDAVRSAEGFRAHRFDHYDPADLVALAMTRPPAFEPGTRWAYSNTNYILAGMIIERVTGRPWEVTLRERILRPLRLGHTFAPGDHAYLPRPHARGYQQFEPDGPLVDTTDFNPSAAYTAGELVSTPSDVARFWRALLGGRLLGPAELAEMRRTVLAETFQEYAPGARYGLGIMWMPSSCGGYWGHGGDVPGTSTVNGVTGDGARVVALALTTRLAGEDAAMAVMHRADRLVEDTLCAQRAA
jgi:D-alanyl-D-alanine carboxypeptidase